ncbi:hypothetical protein KPH14_002128 [Odynerus spinipes]|uniref:Fanconi Anaemia group E protein C-terminal domain-containing protein n=1 Tax=Odynerus spinipes TaxID=1348599 RepID=A0AAD9VNV1_9HYME|nr:hypothetical protein KPH14_002128 [Odynerus spinipes]
MEDKRLFGNYAMSERGLMKLESIKDLLKEDICKADSRWMSIGKKKTKESSSDSEESNAMEVEETSCMHDEQLPSTQFFFTQIERSHNEEDLKQESLQICDIIEVLYEGLERNGKLDFVHIENLSNNELVQVFTDLGEKLSVEGTYNLCSSITDKDSEEGTKYMGFICTHVLLPKIIELEESSRSISSAVAECVEKFPDEVLKFIFIPVLNVDLKDASIINVIIDTLEPSKRSIPILEYVENAKELKEWHIPILETLLSVKVEPNIYDRLLSLLSEKAGFFSTNKKFGKLLLSFLKANSITSEEQKNLLWKIVEVNETFFKKLIENILKTI